MKFSAVLSTALVVGACSKPVERYCDEQTPCTDPNLPFCDLAGDYEASDGISNTCIPDPFGPDAGSEPDAGGHATDAGMAADAMPDDPDAMVREPGDVVFLSQVSGSNTIASSQFGRAVAVDGTRVLVSAANKDDGVVYAFARTGNSYLEDTVLDPSTYKSSPSHFGNDISVVNGQLIVSADNQEQGSISYAGGVFVFDRSGSSWTYNTLLSAASPKPFGVWGKQHAATGTTLVSRGGSSLEVFEKVGNIWTQRFSTSIASGGTAVAVGTGFVATDLQDGAIALYEGAGTSWSPATVDLPTGLQASDEFGAALLAVDSRLYIGAPGRGPGGTVYVYEKQGASWKEVTTITPAVSQNGERFGASIAAGGELIVVGAPGYQSDRGAVYVFEDLGDRLHEHPRLTASDGAGDHQYGYDVATDGTLVVVGAWAHQKGYVYELVP